MPLLRLPSRYITSFVVKVANTRTERVWRIGVAGLQVAKQLPLSARAYAAVHSIDALRKSWRIGIAGLFLKDELLSMLSALRAMNDGASGDKSLAALAGALYYSMAEQRQARGENPIGEAQLHTNHKTPSSTEYASLFEVAPLALNAVYEETLVDMQRCGANHGYSLLFGDTQTDVGRPAFAVFAKRRVAAVAAAEHTNGGESTAAAAAAAGDPADEPLDADSTTRPAGIVILAVRGTNDLSDAIIDARCEGVRFDWGGSPPAPGADNGDEEGGSGCGWAHRGILEAAQWLLAQVLIPLRQLASGGHTIQLCGHSLGAGVASVLTILLKPHLPNVKCIGFATPSVIAGEPLLSTSYEYMTSVILRRDAIPRATIQSIRALLSELAAFDSARKWRRDIKRDSIGFLHRATNILCGEAPVRPVNMLLELPPPPLRTAAVGGAEGDDGGEVAPVRLTLEAIGGGEEVKLMIMEATGPASAEVKEEVEEAPAALEEEEAAAPVAAGKDEPPPPPPPTDPPPSRPTTRTALTNPHIPGRVLHLYSLHGGYRAAWLPDGAANFQH